MPKRKKKLKFQPLTEIRISPRNWAMFLSTQISEKGLATEEVAEKITALFSEVCEHHLICTKCNRVLDDDAFYIQSAQIARRQRAQVCKECWKTHYSKKGARQL